MQPNKNALKNINDILVIVEAVSLSTYFREKLNIKEEDVISIGDSENDLTMFDHAGLKLAMGNAVEKLKELADHILPSNDDFGVKVAIERFILNNFTLKE